MKKVNHILLISLLSLFWACNEWEAPTAEPAHHLVMSSEADYDNRVEVGGKISFGDISRGVVSRTWTLPEGAVMEGTEKQTSTADVIHAVFHQVGVQEVKLSQTFASSAYIGDVQVGANVDTSFTVTVLEPIQIELTAKYVNGDGIVGEELVLTDNAKNPLMAGESIRFFYTATGEPAEVVYTLKGAGNEEVVYDLAQLVNGVADETDVQYKKLGVYSMAIVAQRDRPFGTDTIQVSNFIEVVPSTEPVVLTGVYAKEGKIALDFSREIDPLSVDQGAFVVTIENGDNVLAPTIAKASIDVQEGNIVLLELEGETIYNDDLIKVSYTPGTMRSTDFVTVDAIKEEPLIFKPSENILSNGIFDYGFENSTASNWPYLWWGAPWDGYTLDVVDTESYTGSKSAKITILQDQGMIIGHQDASGTPIKFTAEAGKQYEIGVWIKLESTGTIDDGAGELPNLIFFFDPSTNWGAGRFDFTSQTPVGEWVYARLTFEEFPANGEYTMWLRGVNKSNSGDITFYMDNFTISEVALRP
ncbi:hypothetical protein [Algivirga pacifica]|uniref:Uncharacterized protein n=1 Tax=Algivirga pacifica TaxID=1162670 RepID=A0ABP9CWV8_9BACT